MFTEERHEHILNLLKGMQGDLRALKIMNGRMS